MSSLKNTSKNNKRIYDVGLHRGQDTDFYLKKGFNVVAFEANPENAAFCRDQFKTAIDDGRQTIIEGAIAENFAHNGADKVVKNRDAVVKDYNTVFVKYWLFGVFSFLIQTERGQKFIATMERLFRRSIEGWYNTHARHESIAV